MVKKYILAYETSVTVAFKKHHVANKKRQSSESFFVH